MIKLVERMKRVAVLGLGVFMLLAAVQAGAQEKLFDHADTGFVLSGGHQFAACESCHINGQFAGTPHQCVSCHSLNGRFNATPKPINHINTSSQCDSCHTEAVWNAVPRVDHAEVFGACVSCHNPNIAPGKPVDHLPTVDDCSSCHSDLSWLPANFTHDGAIGQCVDCHNNVREPGQPADHISVLPICGDCHSTFAWTPVLTVDHDLVQGTCVSCHDGVRFIGKPPGHIDATNQCEACHTAHPVPFMQVDSVDHDHIPSAPGNCASCHADDRSTEPFHIPFTGECSECHTSTMRWRFLGVSF